MKLAVQRTSVDAVLPERKTTGAAGYDLTSPMDGVVPKLGQTKVNLFLKMAIPTGYYGKIHERSGLANNKEISVMAGVIDDDYRGEVCVILKNHSTKNDFRFYKGDRIAQIIFQKYEVLEVQETKTIGEETQRGEGGFGSTGFGSVTSGSESSFEIVWRAGKPSVSLSSSVSSSAPTQKQHSIVNVKKD